MTPEPMPACLNPCWGDRRGCDCGESSLPLPKNRRKGESSPNGHWKEGRLTVFSENTFTTLGLMRAATSANVSPRARNPATPLSLTGMTAERESESVVRSGDRRSAAARTGSPVEVNKASPTVRQIACNFFEFMCCVPSSPLTPEEALAFNGMQTVNGRLSLIVTQGECS